VCDASPLTLVACGMTLVETGLALPVVFPLPNWPVLFRPQHLTVWSESEAQVWSSPAPIVAASVIPLVETGVGL